MNRRRLRQLKISAIAIFGSMALYGVSHQIAGSLAKQDQLRAIELIAREAIDRTDSVLNEAGDTLRELHQLTPRDCSPEHISRLKEVAFESSFLREAGFVAGDWLLCTSFGVVSAPVWSGSPDWDDSEGNRIWYSVRTLASPRARSMVIQWADHNVLIDPRQFVDVRSGELEAVRISVLNHQGRLLADIQRGTVNAGALVETEFASQRYPIVARVSSPLSATQFQAARYLQTQLPIAALLALVLVILARRWILDTDTPDYRLRRLLDAGRIDVAYQPIVHLRDRSWIGCEALVRWPQDDQPALRPDEFVPLAERLGLIGRLTDLVVARSLEQLGDFLRVRPEFYVALNLAAEDFTVPRILPILQEGVRQYGLQASQLRVEATERGFINPQAAIEVIRALRESGHMVALDDFGTGYSSLGLLHEVTVDVLKIDRMFVMTIDKGESDRSVIDHIIDMARSLRLATVAEGIETEAQCAYLQARDVEYGQGYLFSRPLSAHDLVRRFQLAERGA
jgi:sensor c-di-GMP phosphodiesterase-like protein